MLSSPAGGELLVSAWEGVQCSCIPQPPWAWLRGLSGQSFEAACLGRHSVPDVSLFSSPLGFYQVSSDQSGSELGDVFEQERPLECAAGSVSNNRQELGFLIYNTGPSDIIF